MNYKKLRIEVSDRVGYIFLSSEQRFNKLTINTLRELKRAISELGASDEVVCIVLTGCPGESFAVGADIGQMVKFGAKEAFAFAELGQSLFSEMESCSKPIIGALNGITMGGGLDLALACDIRLACNKAVLAHPGAKLGIITGFCGTQKLPRLIGKNRAYEVFMTSEPIDAKEALRIGLVDLLFEDDEFLDKVKAFASAVAANPSAALAAAKKALNASEDVDIKNGCLIEQGMFAVLIAEQQN